MIPKHLPLDDPRKTTVVVASSSRYRQAWMPFFVLFRKHWPDCPYKICLATDTQYVEDDILLNQPWRTDPIHADPDGISIMTVDKDSGWCTNMREILSTLETRKIILFQEDFLLNETVKTHEVRQLVQYSHNNDAGCLRLCPCPGPTEAWKDPFMGIIRIWDDYRFSFQLSIWDTEMLIKILEQRNSPWELERDGNIITSSENLPFLSLWRESYESPGGPIRYFITAITRGRWEKGAVEMLRKEGIPTNGITLEGRIP